MNAAINTHLSALFNPFDLIETQHSAWQPPQSGVAASSNSAFFIPRD
jgi:hypothetical protein